MLEPRPADGMRLSRWHIVRVLAAALLIAVCFGFVVHRAYRLQVVESRELREMAEQQYLSEMELAPRRGAIHDRHGAPLALSVDVPSIFANPRMIADAGVAARRIGAALGLPPRQIERRLRRKGYFAWIKRRVSQREARAVRELKIRGVAITQDSRRFYPNRALGGAIVGFSGIEGRGLEGVELALDSLLRGSRQRVVGLRDALGRSVFAEGLYEPQTGGKEVVLALDKFIQFQTEKALAAAQPEVRPTGWVAAAVLDPRNGDVLALGNAPSFDPNRYAESQLPHRRNRTITDAFEPGSVMKPFTIAAALEHGVVRPRDSFDCRRGVRIGRHTINDAHALGILDVGGVLKKSSNICTTKIALKLGKQRLRQALLAFGFGQPTGLGLPGERAGVLRSAKSWGDIGLATVSFGQGMTATILQLTRAYAALANGGRLVRPRLVREVRDPAKGTVQKIPEEGQQVIPREIADTVRTMLRGTTEEGGTATTAALDHYTVAGKTGTAQKVDPVTGTYATDRWVSSFIGVVPASKPRLVIAVVVNEPSGTKHYGGEVAGPIFKEIAGAALRYLNVPPDRAPPPPKRAAPALLAKRPQLAAPDAPATPAPASEDDTPGGAAVGGAAVPDFTGMSVVEAVAAARQAGLRIEIEGSGSAAAQSPGPGPAPGGTTCLVSFRPPG